MSKDLSNHQEEDSPERGAIAGGQFLTTSDFRRVVKAMLVEATDGTGQAKTAAARWLSQNELLPSLDPALVE